MTIQTKLILPAFVSLGAVFSGCDNSALKDTNNRSELKDTKNRRFVSEPLVTHMYTADPSARVWNDTLYIYPSHDIAAKVSYFDEGARFDMRDYHVLSLDTIGDEVTDHGVALSLDDVPWAHRQMWAPDAARKDHNYYLYFPAKDENHVFRIGVAISDSPTGPFEPMDEPIAYSYSIDPAVFEDDDGAHYMYIGGIWGGQLQRWQTGEYVEEDVYPAGDEPAIAPIVARMADDMVSFAEEPKEVQLLYQNGTPILAGDNEKRFFEAAWVHKYDGTYYFSYSTGDTHYIAYATGDSPHGPFTYQGVILEPVLGWTNHHSIAEFEDQWYLFYHDSSLSGQTHLRSVKMMPLTHNEDGTIETMSAFAE